MERYKSQLKLEEIGSKGQKKLGKTSVCIIGVGGLGSASAEMIVRAGIGKVVIIDNDLIELSNLQRQGMYTEKHVGKPKALVAKKILSDINSDVNVVAYNTKLTQKNINLIDADVIVDGTDNFKTRLLINEYVVREKIPCVFACCAGTKGLVLSYLPGKACFKCVFGDKIGETCSTLGIVNTLPKMIAAVQVNEVFKILLGKEIKQELICFDVWNNTLQKNKVKKNPKCYCLSKDLNT